MSPAKGTQDPFSLEIVTKKTCLFEVQILDRKHVLSKKQTCFRFLQQVAPVSISISFPRMVENGGTGSSSTGKSLLEALHEAGGGKEAWQTQNKITESDAAYGKGIPWSEVFTRNSVGLGFKSMCRDEHGQPAARYDDSGRNPIGVDIVYHYDTSPTGTDRLPSEATLPIVAGVSWADFAPTTPISTSSDQQFSVGAQQFSIGSKSRGATLPSTRNRRRKKPTLRTA